MTAMQDIHQHALQHGWTPSELTKSPLWFCRRQYLYKGQKFIVIEWDSRGAIEFASLWAAGMCFDIAKGKRKRRKVFGWIRAIKGE